jgi:hypothetical protein
MTRAFDPHFREDKLPFCRKQRKLAKIWRAIARRWRCAELRAIVISYHAGDDYEI